MADNTGEINATSTVVSPVTGTEEVALVAKPGKAKPKRLSKSERTHQRRLKQAARKPTAVGS
jgi:hypothetical protein